MKSSFDQKEFTASAAALVASHAMSDAVWRTYFPELPKEKPELRSILIECHEQALAGKPFKKSEAIEAIEERFDVSDNTADDWINILVDELGFLVEMGSRTDRRTKFLVPSREAKAGLFNVGQEYIVCFRRVAVVLRFAAKIKPEETEDLDWMESVNQTINREVIDYPTSNPEEKKK